MPMVARLTLVAAVLAGCSRPPAPVFGTPEYEEAVAAFHTGVAAIQVGEDERAERALRRLVELAPREPAGTANLALLAFQQRRYDDAARWVSEAVREASDDGRIRILAALVERRRGRLDAAIEHVLRVTDTNAVSARAHLLLTQLLEQRSSPGDAAESRRVLDALLARDSNGLFLSVYSARHAARQGDSLALAEAVDRLEAFARSWPAGDQAVVERVRSAVGRPADAGVELTLLAASIEALPGYASERAVLTISEQQPDIVITELRLLPVPSPRVAEPDLELRYAARVIGDAIVYDVHPIWTREGTTRVAMLGPEALWIAGDSGVIQRIPVAAPAAAPAGAHALSSIDYNHDFRTDLAAVQGGRLELLRQEADGRFVAVGRLAYPATTHARTVTGVWAADTDLDGDVDLVVAVRSESPFILRNRGDGRFAEITRFDGVRDVRAFAWGDIDDDGVPDATFVDADGHIHVFSNPRQDRPFYVRIATPDAMGDARAIALGDLNSDGRFELLFLRRDGALVSASYGRDGWLLKDVAHWPESASTTASASLRIADLDNNGALDVAGSAAGRTRTWLADSSRALVAHETLPLAITAATDLQSTGRIELLGVDTAARAFRFTPRPVRDYYALTISPRATEEPGDRRINTFGIGGEAEIRAGLSYQKQPITSPVVHFGIGRNTGVTVARIRWPNGTAQAEFDLLASQGRPIVAEQRLKGSCPWLFAFDGNGMQFVTDVAWRTALGLRINAVDSSAVVHSEDRVRIRGDQLAEQDGVYDLRITGELWESHFFDHVALLVVDHPVGTEIFVDERFTLPPPDTAVRITSSLRPIAKARDDAGRDVTRLLADRDDRYVDGFTLGEFQGMTRSEHFVEIDLGADAATDTPLLLVAHGWVQPTDGSINFAMGQGAHAVPHGVRVEVPDAHGGWRVLHADLGMPAGKSKTVLIDLDNAFGAGIPARVRLATNMEIYWDQISWTEALPGAAVRIERLVPELAELRYRGFSRVRRAGRKAPEIPVYEIEGTAPRWSDLEGWHTRFGDVRPLLEDVDDRYAIMNAGDEMVLHFRASPRPDAGLVRDFLFVSDAWVKDGDYNNGFSSTLLPLPYHGLDDYATPPLRLADDPVFRRHARDWHDYHTRAVTSARFRHALVPH